MKLSQTAFLVLAASLQAHAQGQTPGLQRELLAQVDVLMHAWQQKDAAALSAVLAPEFLYASSQGVAPREGVVFTA